MHGCHDTYFKSHVHPARSQVVQQQHWSILFP